MAHPPITALTCPACGAPLGGHAARRCAFCGVALIVPDETLSRTATIDVDGLHGELARLRRRLGDDPSRADTHRRLGRIYGTLGLTDDAVRALTVAVGLAPEDTGTRLELATLLAGRSAMGMPDSFPAAMRHVRQLLTLAPDSPDAHLLLARLQTQRGDFDTARATLERIAALPRDEILRRAAWVRLAEAATRERQGRRTDAVASWRLAAVHAPEPVRAAVVGFLDRATVGHRAVPPARAVRPGGWPSRPVTPRWRSVSVAIVVALAGLTGLAALGAGSTWMVGLAIAAVALVPLRRWPGAAHEPVPRTLARRHDPETRLDDLLRAATVIAARLDARDSARQGQWADNFPVEIAAADRPRTA